MSNLKEVNANVVSATTANVNTIVNSANVYTSQVNTERIVFTDTTNIVTLKIDPNILESYQITLPLEKPVENNILKTTNDNGNLEWSAFPNIKTYKLYELQPTGVNGGTATAGSWFTRTLNTIDGEDSNVTLSLNSFTLQPGKYTIRCEIYANASVGVFQTRLFNDTTSSVSAVGSNQNILGNSILLFNPVITAPTTYHVEQRVTTTVATFGLGSAANFGEPEIYTQVTILKISN